MNDLGDLLSHRGRGLSHCPFGEHRVSLSPVAMVYPGTHRNVVRDPGVSPPDLTIRFEFSGTRISPHWVSVNETDMQIQIITHIEQCSSDGVTVGHVPCTLNRKAFAELIEQ